MRFTPYTDRYIDFGGYYAISRYRGILRIDDIEEAYMPDRFLRQFGYVQTVPLPRIPPHQEVRLDRGRGTRVSYAPIYDAWTSRHLEETRVSLDGLVPAHSPWLVDDAYMPWYTTHCHPYILPTSIAVQIPVDRPPPVPVSDSRVRLFLFLNLPIILFYNFITPCFIFTAASAHTFGPSTRYAASGATSFTG